MKKPNRETLVSTFTPNVLEKGNRPILETKNGQDESLRLYLDKLNQKVTDVISVVHPISLQFTVRGKRGVSTGKFSNMELSGDYGSSSPTKLLNKRTNKIERQPFQPD